VNAGEAYDAASDHDAVNVIHATVRKAAA